ncbi:MAG: DUF177 domain-containing protein [Gemmatimonadetes bacterium]|jgi:uncharacterized protein|nr:DUF177 domain-containing protein [Gemmatimonadota bacterium]MBT5591047.1 DUF177 domain-containing protein [Gemmatimonadota bacterium]MBT5962887.1 DUF177 domain-containing protein [Gemmatimonadota bacterium]MBT6628391.1 DUF177 domain-containing protein [Gemmatimonadota bacterium]MBT7453829.1 DUF177 domain-containing protein [Gemmatimonadota bacterium]
MQRRKSPFTSATERLTVRLANDIRPDWILVLDDVEEGVTDRSFRMTAGDLGISDEFLRLETPIHVEITIGRTLQTFALKGRAQGEVHGDCSRCLTAASARFRAKLHLFAQRKEADALELEAIEDEDEVLVVDPKTREISLVTMLHDAVALALPLRIHCKEDCKGLCGQCGDDLNKGSCGCSEQQVDPRWAALAQLK